jgi:hypothetical protein
MSIWSTLYVTQGRDTGLEAIGLRPIFAGMEDLYPLPGWQRFYVADESGGCIPFAVATSNGDGFESFRVAVTS